jgi:hypothetical protein
MRAPLAFKGDLGDRAESHIHLIHRGFRGEHDENTRGRRRWAPRSTLLLAAGISSIFWILLGWLIIVNL